MLSKIKFLIMSLLFIASQNIAFAGITSIDNVFVAGDQYSADFHTRLNRDLVQVEDGENNIVTSQIVDDTLTEADMADEINPRIRTNEGAACEFVYTGLLPVTSGTLATTIGSGTAYPRGYRINKASTTAHSYTASKWTFTDIDINGNFQYSEQTIGGSTPSVASNSIRLARVSTDSTTVLDVQDLRKTSCANGPFSAIADSAGQATLDDLFKNGASPRRFSTAGRTPAGMARGAFVSWDTVSTFKVTSGALYINGKYRSVSTDTTVPTTNDDPTSGVSGLDSGSIASSTRYYVYGIADQDAVKGYSITYSTSASAPSGVTNSRLIGTIVTDSTSLFTSKDAVTVHGISDRELPFGWISFNGTGTVAINDSFNVSGLTDNGTGDYTVVWDVNPNSGSYACSATGKRNSSTGGYTAYQGTGTVSADAVRFLTMDNNGTNAEDSNPVSVVCFGDNRK